MIRVLELAENDDFLPVPKSRNKPINNLLYATKYSTRKLMRLKWRIDRRDTIL